MSLKQVSLISNFRLNRVASFKIKTNVWNQRQALVLAMFLFQEAMVALRQLADLINI